MYQRIMVPVDGSKTSTQGLEEALKIARLSGGRVCLVNVVDEFSIAVGMEGQAVYNPALVRSLVEAGQRVLDDGLARAVAGGIQADQNLVESLRGRVSDEIVDRAKAWGADLIVVGTHGRRGVGRVLLGSDAEQIVRTSPVPVLLVRGRDIHSTGLATERSDEGAEQADAVAMT